ncbi:MAG: damage-control phosphatase ARMT1 family protein [Candidatus Thorarchaeota archaeon]
MLRACRRFNLKVSLECVHCLLQRAVNQTRLATDDPELQMQVMMAMTRFLADNLSPDSVPSHIGTDRDLLVQRMTGKDPYAELKHKSNQMALELLPGLQKLVEESGDERARFRRAALVAAAANAIEFDVSGREFDLEELRDILARVEHDLAIDEVDAFRELCQNSHEVLYLMDNAGEVVLDMVLISEIRKLGPRVIAYVKGGPVLNDATMEDALEVGLDRYADEVRDTGAAAIGVNLERNSQEFREALFSAELIVAKGMGNYESMTEFDPPCPVVHILRTKCEPVARHVGVPRNKNVVLIRRPAV